MLLHLFVISQCGLRRLDMKKIFILSIFIFLFGCGASPPENFGNNQETKIYIKDLSSDFKDVSVNIQYKKGKEAGYYISIRCEKSLFGSSFDWKSIILTFFNASKELFTKYGNDIVGFSVWYQVETTGGNLKKWATINLKKTSEVINYNYDSLDTADFANRFLELRAKGVESRKWLQDYCKEKNIRICL